MVGIEEERIEVNFLINESHSKKSTRILVTTLDEFNVSPIVIISFFIHPGY